MSEHRIFTYVQATASQWTAANTILALGEPGYETDTGKMKVGDGSTVWNSLGYYAPAHTHDESEVNSLVSDLALKAPLVSPALTTPNIGAATATTVNKIVITAPAASATLTIADGKTLTVNGDTTLTNGAHSGTNTGDQSSVSGNAGTATALATPRAINGVNFDGTAPITVPAAGSTLTDAVPNAKLATMAATTVKANNTGGVAAPTDIDISTTLKTALALAKADVGLSSVDNTTDVGKPVSTAQQTALNLKANLDSPALTTPNIGVATATTVNKVTVTQPATGSTLTIVEGATLTASATASVAGTHTGTSSGTNTGDQSSVSGSAGSLSVSGQTGLMTVTGLLSTSRIKNVRDAADTILELGGSYTPTGTWTNMTLANPALGTPASGTLTNCTFPTLNQNTTGSAAKLDSDGTTLDVNAIADGEFLKRVGTTIVGATVAGGGDMLKANNLSDVTNAATSFTNIKQAATTSATGVVELATDGENAANIVPQANDSRLADARTPTDASVTAAKFSAVPRIALARVQDFRLSGVTATPVMTADSTSLGTIFLCPFKGNSIALYDGTNWNLYQPSSERSIAVTGRTTDLPFDIFAFDSGGVVTLELLDWTNATTRATALVRQDGVWCKTGALTRRYLGSCRARSATTFHWVAAGTDLPCKFDLFNADNRIAIGFKLIDSVNTHTYTVATWRQWAGSTNYQIDVMVGLREEAFQANALASSRNSTISIPRHTGIGFDSTTVLSGVNNATANTVASIEANQTAAIRHMPTIGRHIYQWLQISTATGTCTWIGDDGALRLQSGVTGIWTC